MRTITRLAGAAAVLTLALVTWPAAAEAMPTTTPTSTPAAAAAAPSDQGLGLALRTAQAAYDPSEPIRLTLAVTNASTMACGLTTVAEGSVQIVSVRKDGEELTPVLGRSFYLDGIDSAITAGLAKAEPGSTTEVALVSVRVGDGADPNSAVLRSVAVSSGGGGLDTLWPVGAPGRYEVTASYAVPAVDGAVTPCVQVTPEQTIAFTVGEVDGGFSWLWLVGGAVLIVVIGALVIVLLVRRRHRASAAVILLLIGLTAGVAVPSRPAFADVTVDPNSGIPVPGVDFQNLVNGCMKGFAAPGGDPAGILPRLTDKKTPPVRIIPTTSGSGAFETPDGPGGKGSSTVSWNPTSVEPYGDGVVRDPCAALYHELNHADDISKARCPRATAETPASRPPR